jgi:hypothetical protein
MQQDVGWEGKPDGRRTGSAPPDRPLPEDRPERLRYFVLAAESAWPSAKHFTSWLCLAPSNKISGGKVLSSRTRRGGSRAAALLRLAAVTVGRTDTALGAFYRRLSARIGKAKAVTASAEDRGPVLQRRAARNAIRRSRCVVLRDPLSHAGDRQSTSARQGIRICSPAHGSNPWGRRFLGIIFERQLADLWACSDFTSIAGRPTPLPRWDQKRLQLPPRAALSTR